MCGRFVGNYSVQDVLDDLQSVDDVQSAADGAHLHVDELVLPLFDGSGETGKSRWTSFNVAPSAVVPVVIRPPGDDGTLLLTAMQWGFFPSWSKESGKTRAMINARSETVLEKPMFRGDVAHHRCAVPMSGFYEWDRSDSRVKRPYFVTRSDRALMWCLGLWSTPRFMDGGHTFALLTRASQDRLASIHDRAPVQVNVRDACDWIISETPLLELCGDETQAPLQVQEVSTRVNQVRNNDATLLEPVTGGTLFE